MERITTSLESWQYNDLLRIAQRFDISMSEVLRIDSILVRIEMVRSVCSEYTPSIDLRRFTKRIISEYRDPKMTKEDLREVLEKVKHEGRFAMDLWERLSSNGGL